MARILIVDDSLMIRRLLREIFSGAGHEVVGEAHDGVQAEQKLRAFQADPEHRPDLVTLNLIMPVRGGLDTLPVLVEIDPGLAVVICSASLDRLRVIRAIRLGAAGFIAKPFTRESALSSIEVALAYMDRTSATSWQDSLAKPLAELTEDASDERREFVRIQARRMVRITPDLEPPFSTATVDISAGGMLLETARLRAGDAVNFELELGQGQNLHGRAHVARVDDRGRPGLAFVRVSVDDHERLVDFLRLRHEGSMAPAQ